MTTVLKYLKRIRARDSILERKRAPRRHVLPEKKLENIGARLEKSTRYSFVLVVQLPGFSATPGRIPVKLMNIRQLWFTTSTT